MRDADGKSKVEDAAEAVKTLNGKEIDGEEWYVGKWYMKIGVTFEGNPDEYPHATSPARKQVCLKFKSKKTQQITHASSPGREWMGRLKGKLFRTSNSVQNLSFIRRNEPSRFRLKASSSAQILHPAAISERISIAKT
ncbi:hypothetical protein SADUNF_Sadunf01G0115000 [Salix dunnii]|uniref:Uncharacterized protein n=1 Tax=Salix dunnii TaxID=1413687 RepID=A0A835TMD4_9ROSI|nr:hypothetical protein SADUNF_Sadunf01G0115000 [Salix dunnii]